ncbi:response regulator transcription factor [Saccharopolyspora cebuensis]|uniref:Response regulator transcription factor n=1 Tax=Saccharopolyspora cebuensis TaxID=418759 RepID=A0ABV4CDZ2_9PSEU
MAAKVEPGTTPPEQRTDRVRVSVWAADPITLVGVTETLVGSLDVFVTPDEQPSGVDVLVFATDRVTPAVVASMRRAAAATTAPAVLVTRELDHEHLMSVVECRVVAVLHRGAATEERLVGAVRSAAAGGATLPPNLLGALLRQVQALQQEVLAPRGLNPAGLSTREIDVVRLMAEGWDTEEIASRLCYSERTVKNIIHTMTNRLEVRNRPQLVAYAVRAGLV